jgi:hypothetical protein
MAACTSIYFPDQAHASFSVCRTETMAEVAITPPSALCAASGNTRTFFAATKPILRYNLFGASIGGPIFSTRGANPFVPNGLIVNLSVPDFSTELLLTTAQGDFNFRLNQLAYGKPLDQLKGRVWVDRMPASTQLTRTTDEEDYPSSAVTKNGDVWIAYLQFKHNPNHTQLRAAPGTAIRVTSRS